eukprot:TRINITY_DN587_c0_g1_i1.p2 TRINITY_DN587_c0_g1~~TRINITY_DN587_c0_g1_i1.p2  ORF type:complete len:712 (+),score=54.71 TRINITY_DN587_c0_g1_i1:3950-6085(+)
MHQDRQSPQICQFVCTDQLYYIMQCRILQLKGNNAIRPWIYQNAIYYQKEKMQQAFEELATQRRLLFHSAGTESLYKLSNTSGDVSSSEKLPSEFEPRILILYVGGTLGMMKDPERGYIPKENYLVDFMYHHPALCDIEFTKNNCHSEHLDFLYTPVSPFGKRIKYQLQEFKPLLDSTDMDQGDWVSIAKAISDNYNNFDAFIVLHGTDTVALTASALSFMLENLRKTVIVTAAMIPLFEMRNDAINNIICALLIAGHYWIPEVTVMFHNKLYRGNRIVKESSHHINAIRSPRCPPLAKIGTSIKMNWPMIFRVRNGGSFTVFTKLETRITRVRITPYMTTKTFAAMMSSKFKGIVLETYGPGNFPTDRPELLEIIQNVVSAGVVVVNISQCRNSMVSDFLGNGKILTDVGVVNGCDMTAECTLAKLSYLLGKYPAEKAKKQLQMNLRGELTPDTANQGPGFPILRYKLLERLTERLDIVLSPVDYKCISANVYPCLVIQAASEGNVETLLTLKKQGADLNTADPELRTAAHVAALCGKREVIKFLIKEGVNINQADGYSSSPLYYAVEKKHYDIARDLLRVGGEFKCTYNQVISMLFLQVELLPKHRAAKVGNKEQLQILQECNVDFKLLDKNSYNIVHEVNFNSANLQAAYYKQYGVLEMLAKVDPEIFELKDIEGKNGLCSIEDEDMRRKISELVSKNLKQITIQCKL